MRKIPFLYHKASIWFYGTNGNDCVMLLQLALFCRPGAEDPGAGDPGAGDPGAGDPGAEDPGAVPQI